MRPLTVAALILGLPAFAQDAPPLTAAEYAELVRSIDLASHIITADQFLARRAEGAVVLDLRAAEAFANLHIEGALHLGAQDITAARLAQLVPDPTTPILIYCDNSFMLSRRVALTDIALPQLIALGYKNVAMADMAGLSGAIADNRLPMVPN